jgi:hypothetical protein
LLATLQREDALRINQAGDGRRRPPATQPCHGLDLGQPREQQFLSLPSDRIEFLLFTPMTARTGWVIHRASSRMSDYCCRADSSWAKNVSASARLLRHNAHPYVFAIVARLSFVGSPVLAVAGKAILGPGDEGLLNRRTFRDDACVSLVGRSVYLQALDALPGDAVLLDISVRDRLIPDILLDPCGKGGGGGFNQGLAAIELRGEISRDQDIFYSGQAQGRELPGDVERLRSDDLVKLDIRMERQMTGGGCRMCNRTYILLGG